MNAFVKKSFFYNFCLILIPFLFFSCSKNGSALTMNAFSTDSGSAKNSAFRTQNAKMTSLKTADFDVEEAFEMEAAMDEAVYKSESGTNSSGTSQDSFTERKLIKNGNINLEVESLEGVEQVLENFVQAYGGYITDSSSYENSYSATLRIPSEKIDDAMNAVGSFGKIKFRNLHSQDVTEEFYDLQTRLSSKKIMRSNLEKYLTQAKDIKDLLEIERQLNSVITDIEVMEGRMKRLSNQIEFSTLYVNMNLPTGFSETGFVWPDLGEDFKRFGVNFVNFCEKLFMGIFYISIFGAPLVAIVAFLFWLLFGRLGLLIRLFKRLAWKKKD